MLTKEVDNKLTRKQKGKNISNGDKGRREKQACDAEYLGGHTQQDGPGRLLRGEVIGLCKEPASDDLGEGLPKQREPQVQSPETGLNVQEMGGRG